MYKREKPIVREDHILRLLGEEGWQGDADTLRNLARMGERLRKRWENECSYEWANTPDYEAGTERAAKRIKEAAARAGLTLFLQTDPRGAAVYVRAHPLPISDTSYSSTAHCLYYQ